jgi:shikimate dehydrogenase
MMKQFGVIGHPIAHSLSPLMHNTAFALLGLDCTYQACDVPGGALADALEGFKCEEFVGLNVTIPHKEAVLDLLDEVDPEAGAIGAVNTIAFEGARLIGHNTDAYGVLKSLEPFRAQIVGDTALLLGAGGAARAVSYVLLTHFFPSELVIANRSEQRAQDLAAQCKALSANTTINAMSLADSKVRQIIERSSLVINATSVGMTPSVDESPIHDDVPFHTGQIVMDLIYTPLETNFLKIASGRGARTISGLEMFIHQGARSFEIWTGQQMPVDRIRSVLAQRLKTNRV